MREPPRRWRVSSRAGVFSFSLEKAGAIAAGARVFRGGGSPNIPIRDPKLGDRISLTGCAWNLRGAEVHAQFQRCGAASKVWEGSEPGRFSKSNFSFFGCQ